MCKTATFTLYFISQGEKLEHYNLRFEVLMAVKMSMLIFRVVTRYNLSCKFIYIALLHEEPR
jgi:hypothetical protein